MVFSIPKRLRTYFKHGRKNTNLLFLAAWETVQALFSEVLPAGRPAAIQVLQTAGASLNFNPHLHNLVADGVYGEDGTFYQLGYINTDKATEYFAHRVLRHMLRAGLVNERSCEQILSQTHTGFSVWAGDVVWPTQTDTRHFLARYIDRGPVVLGKVQIDHDIITYETDDELTHEFDGTEFLARLQQHIPSRYESVVRYYGAWSYRYRGEQKKRELKQEALSIQDVQIPKKKASRAWAVLIQKVYEVDPLVCPKCGSQMKIVEFPKDPAQILKLAQSLGIPKFKAPPPLRSPPKDFLCNPEDENQEFWSE
jgi:hypothetical protein